MGRLTTAMWWGGLLLLFASGLLFGLAVADAEADGLDQFLIRRLVDDEYCRRLYPGDGNDAFVKRVQCTARLSRARLDIARARAGTTPVPSAAPQEDPAAQAADALARQTREQATDACEAQWGRNALMVEHCRTQAGGGR
jgi:hypothetical protein